MGWLAWIVIGMLAGVLAKMVLPGTRNESVGLVGTLLVGIVGAVLGGWIGNVFNAPGANGINFDSLLVAFVGSCIVLGIMRLFDRSARTY